MSRASSFVLLPSMIVLYASTSIYVVALVWSNANTNQLAFSVGPCDHSTYGGDSPDVRDSSGHAVRIQSWMISVALDINVSTMSMQTPGDQ